MATIKFGSRRVKLFEIYRLLTALGYIHESLLPGQFSFFFWSYGYFPHQTWNKPFEMVLLTSKCEIKNYTLILSINMHKWNNRPVKITTRFSGNDEFRRLFRERTQFAGSEPKNGWELRLHHNIIVYCIVFLTILYIRQLVSWNKLLKTTCSNQRQRDGRCKITRRHYRLKLI